MCCPLKNVDTSKCCLYIILCSETSGHLLAVVSTCIYFYIHFISRSLKGILFTKKKKNKRLKNSIIVSLYVLEGCFHWQRLTLKDLRFFDIFIFNVGINTIIVFTINILT